MLRKLTATSDDPVMTILRLVLGVVFFFHGSQKVLGWFGGYGFSGTMNFFTHNMGIPAAFAFLAIAAEFLGSLGLILGLLARVAASGIIVNMVMAILMVHRANGIFMNWSGNQKGEGYHARDVYLDEEPEVAVKGKADCHRGRLKQDRIV